MLRKTREAARYDAPRLIPVAPMTGHIVGGAGVCATSRPKATTASRSIAVPSAASPKQAPD
jgi:hypothetical protein